MINVSILGSTGSIGVSTLDVISQHPQSFRVFALTANTGVEQMLKQCLQWRPRYATRCPWMRRPGARSRPSTARTLAFPGSRRVEWNGKERRGGEIRPFFYAPGSPAHTSAKITMPTMAMVRYWRERYAEAPS